MSVCATATAPKHTVAVDTTGVATVGGDTAANCATTTYTIPTVTTTVTEGGTTGTTTTGTTSTTGTTTTTSGGGGLTYEQAIAYTQTRPTFTPKRTIAVSTAAELKSAISGLQPGDLVRATSGFTVTSTSSAAPLTIDEQLSAPAEIDLTAGVKFVYAGSSDTPAVYIHNAENIWIFGGDASSGQGGSCILAHGAEHMLWWGFTAHDCGGSGISLLTATDGGPTEHNDFQGELWNMGQAIHWDNHKEKGTGFHCAGEMADGQGGQPFTDNRLAFYCHDVPVGEAFAFGVSPLTPDLGFAAAGEKNTLYLKAVNLTCVAKIQTCGNAITLWGHTSTIGLDIKYLEVDHATGYALIDNAVSSGYNLDGVSIDYGRATDAMTDTYPKGAPLWGRDLGQTFGDLQPAS